jgi:hypothetical protein
VVDLLIQPVVAWTTRAFRLGGRMGYMQYLLFTIGLLLVVLIAGHYLVRAIAYWLSLLPF